MTDDTTFISNIDFSNIAFIVYIIISAIFFIVFSFKLSLCFKNEDITNLQKLIRKAAIYLICNFILVIILAIIFR